MRSLAVIVGGLLLIGGAVLTVIADQERAAGVEAIRNQIAQVQRQLDASEGANLELAEKLTALRAQIAEQDAELADTTGFLQ